MFKFLRSRRPVRPVFIIGCGRSGTTILGQTLARHRKITYLEEPRHHWFSAYNETDIWSDDAAGRGAKMVMTAADARRGASKILRKSFYRETMEAQRPVLVEKLPINNFRLGFIEKIFPDARYIHIYRNGLDVARSIATLCESGAWFKTKTYKWEKLVELARGRPETEGLPELCLTWFQQGLLEWRLSERAAVDFFSGLAPERFVELSYDELVDYPGRTLERIVEFIEVEEDREVARFVAEKIRRKRPSERGSEILANAAMIGGPLLPLSLRSSGSLTAAWIRHGHGRPGDSVEVRRAKASKLVESMAGAA